MKMLIEFINQNKDKLSKEENEILYAGFFLHSELQRRIIKELDTMPRSEACIEDLFCDYRVGRLMNRRKPRNKTEKDSGDMLVLLWDYLMPEMKLISRELSLPSRKRIDILAENKEGERVIIELKHCSASEESKAMKQVKGYAAEINRVTGKSHDIMTINSTGVLSDEMVVMTWGELGIYGDFAHVPDSFDKAELAAISECLNVYPKFIDGERAYRYDVIFDYINNM